MMKKITLIFLFSLLASSLFTASISGFISNSSNGERLAYVSVIVKGTQIGAYTNKEGYFVISNLNKRNYVLNINAMGYESVIKKIQIKDWVDDKFLKIELKPTSIKLKKVDVIRKRYEQKINSRNIVVAQINQTTKDLQNVSQIGEADLFRSIQMLPGVSSISDFSSGLYVRGGSPDQNLILLDNIQVYNPNHFGGIFSTFNTDAVQNVSLQKGGFPAKFGGCLSSVLEIDNLDGNRKHHEGVARTSLISTSSTVQGPWKIYKAKGSYMASFRRTYMEVIDKFIDVPDYYFYDGHAKVNFDISNKDKIQTSFYFGKDKLEMDFGSKMLVEWGNETFTTKWIHIISPELFFNNMIATSHFGSHFNIKSTGDEYFKRKNDIYDYTHKTFFTFTPNKKHEIDFGTEIKHNAVKFVVESNSNVSENSLPNIKVNSFIMSLYTQDNWTISDEWSMQTGIRYTMVRAISKYLENQPYAVYNRFSPRFTIRYANSPLSNYYFSYGNYFQYLTSMNVGISTPFDLWFPIDGTVKPQESMHYIFGYKSQLNEEYAFDIEVYYKDYKNLVEYRSEVDYEWDNTTGTLDDVYNNGKGFAYGLDFLVRNNWNYIQGFVGYTFGVTVRKTESINVNPVTNQPEWYYPKYDQNHQINIVQNYQLSEATNFTLGGGMINLGITYSFKTGQPHAKPEQVFLDGQSIEYLYSYSDRHRLPYYSRLDLSLKCRFDKKNYSIEPYIQIINLLDRENVWDKTYSAELAEDSEINGNAIIETKEDESTMFPRIPFIGVSIEW